MPLFRLVIASPLRQFFDYLPPQELSDDEAALIPPGTRIQVPFGRRSICGILVEQVEHSDVDPSKLRHASKIIDDTPLLDATLMKLCLWAANYYKYPPGEILSAAFPPSLRDGKQYQEPGEVAWKLTVAGLGLPVGAPKRAPKQAQLIDLLRDKGELAQASIRSAGISQAVIRQAQQKELVEQILVPAAAKTPTNREGLALNSEQAIAVAAIGKEKSFRCFLLEGVTGSGKTEVYLQLIAQVLESGKQALVLIPEIGLTPQTLQRFQRRFDAHIVVLHSGLADGAREKAWDDARCGRAHIVLGTRSAVFAGLANPGLIVVDEEHDGSYKQQEGFRYSARDVAVMRAQLEKVPIILGSATPSLESLANVDAGKYQHLALTQRASRAQLPEFIALDVRNQALQAGLSTALLAEIRNHLDAGNQALLFLNRRGYAPTLQCHDCGYIADCKHCDARLTLHRRDGQLRCHHCGWHVPTFQQCPECHGRQLMASGLGTERVEETLSKEFPDLPLFRVDRDSMSRKGAMENVYQQVSLGEPCILLGTQMLTKGHHFPDVTLVGLIDVDTALFSGDFRSPERLGQLLTQVAGRAGRGEKPGRVLLQTHYPDHPLLLTLIQKGYREFALELLEQRRDAAMPPYGNLLLIRAEAGQPALGEQFLQQLRRQFETGGQNQGQCIGPLPAPMQRRQGRFRWQLLVRTAHRGDNQDCAGQLVALAEAQPTAKRVRWSIDVDPQDMM
jgi:primosomal protein N' (replication factor Y) (superfamily II helicase)